jgi:hypothetical protein
MDGADRHEAMTLEHELRLSEGSLRVGTASSLIARAAADLRAALGLRRPTLNFC